MKIVDLDFYLVEVPRAGGRPPVRSLLIRLGSDQGSEGWSECTPVCRPAEVEGRRQRTLGALAGRSPWDLEELGLVDVLDLAALRSGVESACWDLLGRQLGQPVAHFWGGFFRRRVPVAVRLAGSEPEVAVRQARDLIDQPLRSLVVPLEGSPGVDAALIRAVADAAAGHAELWADAAARFDLASLDALCQELETGNVSLLIDPLPGGDWQPWAARRSAEGPKLVASRAVSSPAELLRALAAGAIDAALIGVDRLGGPTLARQCTALAAAAGVSLGLDEGPGLGLGLAARLHLAAASPPCQLALESAYHTLDQDILVEPLNLVDGLLEVPTGAGWGVEVDRAKIERWQIA